MDVGGMHLHPLNYALGLADAAERQGVEIYEKFQSFELFKGLDITSHH